MDFKLSSLFRSVSTPRHEEDFVDRLNCRVTVVILLAFAVGILAKDYGGDPIKCWGRAEWPESWMEYAHDICFVDSTYYLPVNDPNIPESTIRRRSQLDYYQWVPFVLVLQAIGFMLPQLFWKSFNWLLSGIQVRAILTMADQARRSTNNDDYEKNRNAMASHLLNALNIKRNRHYKDLGDNSLLRSTRRFFAQRSLAATYFVMKLMYVANTAIQWYFLGYFLGKSNHWFGYQAVGALIRGETWRDTGLFPRVTLCDFKVRGMKNHIEEYSVQCVLMGNMVNEKIFIALWWWFLILNAVTVANFIKWTYMVGTDSCRKRTLKELLFTATDLLMPFSAQKERELEAEEEEMKKERAHPTESSGVGSHYSSKSTSLNRSTDANDNEDEEGGDQPSPKELYLKQKCDFTATISNNTEALFKFLGVDGILMAELVRINSDDMVASAMVGKILMDGVDLINSDCDSLDSGVDSLESGVDNSEDV